MKKIILIILSVLSLTGCNERDLPEEKTVNNSLDDKLTISIKETLNCTKYLN